MSTMSETTPSNDTTASSSENTSLKRSIHAGGDSVAEQADAKKQKTKSRGKKAHIFRPSELNLSEVLDCGSASKVNMCTLVPVTTKEKKSIYIQLSGGGDIPVSFGLGEMPDNPNKFKLTFNIASDKEHDALDVMRDQLSSVAIQSWGEWFPKVKSQPSEALLRDFCYRIVTEKKERADSSGMYPGMVKATFDVADLESKRCRILHADTKEPVDFRELPGMKWTRAIMEFRHIFIQGSKSYGLTKRLRYIEVTEGRQDEEIIPLE